MTAAGEGQRGDEAALWPGTSFPADLTLTVTATGPAAYGFCES